MPRSHHSGVLPHDSTLAVLVTPPGTEPLAPPVPLEVGPPLVTDPPLPLVVALAVLFALAVSCPPHPHSHESSPISPVTLAIRHSPSRPQVYPKRRSTALRCLSDRSDRESAQCTSRESLHASHEYSAVPLT